MKKVFFKSFAILFAAVFSFVANASAIPVKYEFDKEHTTILFFVNHLGFSDKIGQFRDYDGSFIFDKDNPENSAVGVSFRPTGVDTGSKLLDKELQKKGWFNTEKFPEVTFKSMSITKTGENKADVKGWLTLLGNKKRVTLHVTFNKEGTHPITKDHVAGFSADTKFKRSLFGMTNDVPFVGDTVRIHIETEGFTKE